jgi:hypothetical protein
VFGVLINASGRGTWKVAVVEGLEREVPVSQKAFSPEAEWAEGDPRIWLDLWTCHSMEGLDLLPESPSELSILHTAKRASSAGLGPLIRQSDVADQ